MPEPAIDEATWAQWKEWKKRKQVAEFFEWQGIQVEGNLGFQNDAKAIRGAEVGVQDPDSPVVQITALGAETNGTQSQPQGSQTHQRNTSEVESLPQDAAHQGQPSTTDVTLAGSEDGQGPAVQVQQNTSKKQEGSGQDSDSQADQKYLKEGKDDGKDQTKYVLSGQPTGWAAMDKALRDYDDEKVKDYKEDIDNLLTFTGLFSGVLASFLIESYPKLQENPSGGSSSDLRQMVAETIRLELGGSLSSTTASPHPSSPFRPAAGDIRVNVLWFTSLLLSLIAASFGILVKQWLREYMSFTNPSPQARLRVRHLRYPTLDRWWVFRIAAFLPILVHLSLGLFFVGLIYFTASVHPSIEYTTLPLVGAWGLCFLAFASLPLFFPRCPYRITILKDIYACIHRIVGRFAVRAEKRVLDRAQPPSRSKTSEKSTIIGRLWGRFKWASWRWISWIQRFLRKLRKRAPLGWESLTRGVLNGMKKALSWTFWKKALSQILHKVAHSCERVNEIEVARSSSKDLKVLSDADGIQSNDELLATDIKEAVRQADLKNAPPLAAPKFIHELLCKRLAFPQDDDDNCFATILDLRKTTLSQKVQDTIVDLIVHFIPCLPSSYKGISAMTSRSKSNSDALTQEVTFLQPRLLFALLLCLSGKSSEEGPKEFFQKSLGQSLQQNSSFVVHLSQQQRGPEIVIFCQKIVQSSPYGSTTRSPHWKTGSSNERLVNLLRGISLVHRAVTAQWGLAQVLRSVGSITQYYSELKDPTIGVPKLEPSTTLSKAQQDSLTSFGCRAMHYVVTLDNRTGRLDRAAVEDVLNCLYSDVRKRIKECTKKLTEERMDPSAVENILEVIALNSLVTFLSFQSWRPQWFRLEKLWSNFLPIQAGDTENRVFTLAICCFPTIGILRLCWRAASHSHSSGRQVVTGMNAEALNNWGTIVQYGLKCDLGRDATHRLKLLSFSLYLYAFGTPRLQKIDDKEQQEWKSIFGHFVASLKNPEAVTRECDDTVCHCQKPMLTLATVCLEMIRFEEILVRIMDHHATDPSREQLKNYSSFLYYTPGRTVDVTLILNWKDGLAQPDFVFSAPLINALESLVKPSWSEPMEKKLIPLIVKLEGGREAIKFRDVYVAYEERIKGLVLVGLSDEDTAKWLRGHCGCRAPKYERPQTTNATIIWHPWSKRAPRRQDSPPHGDVERGGVE